MITRREMLRGSLALGGAALFAPHLLSAVTIPENRRYTEQLGWIIGPQLYSFRMFPFDEAIKLTVACGTPSCEAYPGQRVSANIDINIGPDLLRQENRDTLKRVKEILAENGCTVHAFGVCPGDRRHFELTAELGASVLTTNHNPRDLESVNRLADEFEINVGLHNHPPPSPYWDPEVVLGHLKNLGPRMGACADTGHWLRSGLTPLECVKKLKGRIVSFHIKDVKKSDSAFDNDCLLGQGDVGITEILKEFATHEVGFKVPFSIEYEADWHNNQPKVAESVRFFDATAREIVRARS